MLKSIKGSLLDSDCRYIANQCNCYPWRGAGLAMAIFKAFPWADVYSSRSERGNYASIFGSITIHGDMSSTFTANSGRGSRRRGEIPRHRVLKPSAKLSIRCRSI